MAHTTIGAAHRYSRPAKTYRTLTDAFGPYARLHVAKARKIGPEQIVAAAVAVCILTLAACLTTGVIA